MMDRAQMQRQHFLVVAAGGSGCQLQALARGLDGPRQIPVPRNAGSVDDIFVGRGTGSITHDTELKLASEASPTLNRNP
jgi:hypothetical protein